MSTFDPYEMSDLAISRLIGDRLKSLRLRRNVTQEMLAERAQLSSGTVKALECGQGKLLNLIAVLRELGGLDSLDAFLPEPLVSPIDLARRKGRQRKQATGGRGRRKKRIADERR